MEIPSYFNSFLAKIRPQEDHRNALKGAHKEVRRRLKNDKKMSDLIVNTFLQGSYRRSTAIRLHEGKRVDIDVVIVTKIHESTAPEQAMAAFKPFLDKHYPADWKTKDRCIRIAIGSVDVDLVITSAPSESNQETLKSASGSDDNELKESSERRLAPARVGPSQGRGCRLMVGMLKRAQAEDRWRLEPLKIPDCDAEKWEDTNPLEQIKWTRHKNAICNGQYINVVKAIKWWHRINNNVPKYPKGYSLEHLVGVCCPDGIEYVATGVTLTLENIVRNLAGHYAEGTVPKFKHYGAPDSNVWHRVTPEHFRSFYGEVKEAAAIARRAFDAHSMRESAIIWAELFGSSFPSPPEDYGNSGDSGP